MKRLSFLVTGTVVTVALGLGPSAWAQSRPSTGGGGGGGTRTSSGSGGGGGHAAPRSGGGSVSSGGGYSGGHSSGGAVTAPAPSHGSSSGAVSRPGGSRVSGRGVGARAPRGEAVPRGSRPNTGNPAIGYAVPRKGLPPNPDGGHWNNGGYYPYYGSGYYPYWGSYGYYGYGYPWGCDPYWNAGCWGFGFGLYVNPFWWGYGYPEYFGAIYPGSYAAGGGGYSAPDEGPRDLPDAALKLKVEPRDAEVYVDGVYVGQVDSFDGAFQHLDIEPGTHRFEIRAEGYEPLAFDVKAAPRQNLTYKGELKKIGSK
ncbi:MAG: hypothetical protein H6Q10_625 [Acidobacteria bacterium]|nr:hypothetical protein [Acidobacteriota bacterium]